MSVFQSFLHVTLLIITFFSSFAYAYAMSEAPCAKIVAREAGTVEDIVKKSKSIGLYVLQYTSKSQRTLDKGSVGYDYILDRIRKIKGDPKYRISALGYPPHRYVTPAYFETLPLHEELVINNHTSFGSTAYAYIDDEGVCRDIPYGMRGYYFLVIDGVSSQISFELITSPRYDPLVKKIVELSKKKQQ